MTTEGAGASANGRSGETEPAYSDAVGLLLRGDGEGLSALLERNPELVRSRCRKRTPPYDGYFHGATLLHHVAGNPFIAELPSDIAELTKLLLARGAEVDAVTLQGPSQPDDIGWTTLGLVATSAEARRGGHQPPLMDLLVEAGADVDARNGGCLMGALYYGEANAAEYLAARGARLDLAAAAGLGDTARMQELLHAEEDVLLRDRLAHYGLAAWPEDAGRDEVLGVALIYAALHGRLAAIELLLEAGADPAGRPPFDHHATPLHWAAMGDQPEAVRALLAAGADPDARDGSYDSTPEGWARHLGKTRALGVFESGG